MKIDLNKKLKPIIFICIGAVLGYVYYLIHGCTSGCAITSSAYRSAIYGGIMGVLLSAIF